MKLVILFRWLALINICGLSCYGDRMPRGEGLPSPVSVNDLRTHHSGHSRCHIGNCGRNCKARGFEDGECREWSNSKQQSCTCFTRLGSNTAPRPNPDTKPQPTYSPTREACISAGGYDCVSQTSCSPDNIVAGRGDENICRGREMVCCSKPVRQPGDKTCGREGGQCMAQANCPHGPTEQGADCGAPGFVCCVMVGLEGMSYQRA